MNFFYYSLFFFLDSLVSHLELILHRCFLIYTWGFVLLALLPCLSLFLSLNFYCSYFGLNTFTLWYFFFHCSPIVNISSYRAQSVYYLGICIAGLIHGSFTESTIEKDEIISRKLREKRVKFSRPQFFL